MKILQRLNKVPPGGWQYTIPELGIPVKQLQWAFLVQEVRNTYLNNKKKAPANLEHEIQDQICDGIELGSQSRWCQDHTPPTKKELLARATHALREWVSAGLKTVSEEVLLQRREICRQCPYYTSENRFGVQACGKCGCTGLKLWSPTEQCPDGRWAAV